MIDRNIIIAFGNQKGGVGKTTLCTLFANYLAAKGERLIVIDVDSQRTIVDKRESELKAKKEQNPEDVQIPYNVMSINMANPENVERLMIQLRRQQGIVLIDAPGNLAQQGLIPLFLNVDYIVCPFQFEATSIRSTAVFVNFIAKLFEKQPVSPQTFLVPNRVDKRFGKKEERELWQSTIEAFAHYGFVTPEIPYRAELQRYNTLTINDLQTELVGEAFEFVLNHIQHNTHE